MHKKKTSHAHTGVATMLLPDENGVTNLLHEKSYSMAMIILYIVYSVNQQIVDFLLDKKFFMLYNVGVTHLHNSKY